MHTPNEAGASGGMSRRVALILVGLAAAFHAWPLARHFLNEARSEPVFAFSQLRPPEPGAAPILHEEYVTPEAPDMHVASICELPDGRLACAWYSGSAEGATDVCIYFATRDAPPAPGWSEPRVVVSRESAARELARHVRKVGNSVIFADRDGRLWLVYVSVAIGGWSGSSLNVKTSDDRGTTWTRSRRLTLSPFVNISELVKGKPLHLEDGGFALPIYHENMGLFPEMLWVRGSPGAGLLWRKSRIAGGRTFIQPAVVATGPRSAVAFFRCWTSASAVGTSATSDGGATWTRPGFLELPNPNSAVDAVRLSGHRILLVFNDHAAERDNLRLAVSDDGATWTRIATLEEDPEKRYSYPYVIRTRDGLVHVVYTWHGRRIKHVTLNEAWIDEQLAKEAGR
jgi:predicted neuraminidase